MRLACVFVISVCASACALAETETDPAIKSKIAALEQLWTQAYKSGDTKALDSILDDAIVLGNDDGSVQTKAEFLASVTSSRTQSAAQQQQVTPESLNVQVFGNVAIATGVMRVKASRMASHTPGVSALSIPGSRKALAGSASVPTPLRFCIRASSC